MRYANIDTVKAGDIIAQPALGKNGMRFIQANVVLNNYMINRLKELGYTGIFIYDDISTSIILEENVPIERRLEAAESIKNYDNCLFIAQRIADDILKENGIIYTSMSMIGSSDANTYMHSVNVATYSGMMGMLLGYGYEEITNLVAAALMHDLGKTLLDPNLLNKNGKLTPEEYEIIKTHPTLGYEMLKDESSIPSVLRVAILQHHENADGSGYPNGLLDEDTYKFSKIIHLCDVYDAMISKRAYKDRINPAEVIEHIMAQAGIMFNYDMTCLFVKNIIPYPAGILVRLSNGNQAVVKENNIGYAMRPKVIELISKKEIDLIEELDITITEICI